MKDNKKSTFMETNKLKDMIESIKKQNEKRQLEEKKMNSLEKETIKDNYVEFIDIENNCYSKELFEIIKKLGFTITKYVKNSNPDYDDYYCTAEIYSCIYNNWQFDVKNLPDYDIEEGIFAIYDIKNNITKEVVKNYLDIGCRNTSKEKLDNFIMLLENSSYEDFFNKRYYLYKKAIDKLKEFCEVKEILNDVEKFPIRLSLVPELSINPERKKIYFIATETECIISVDEKNSYFYKYYTTTPKCENDINNLQKIVKCFIEDIDGKIGYFENGKYFNNKDIHNFFKKLKETFSYEIFNHYKIQIYRNDYKGDIINKYEGQEIYYGTNVLFNDASQWSIGDIAINFTFVIKYNKELCDKIILNIYAYKINNKTGEFMFKSKEYEDMYNKQEMLGCECAKLDIDEVYECTPDELLSKLRAYIFTTSDTFGYERE